MWQIQTLSASLRAKGPEGEALPSVFPALEAYGAKIRRGQLTLIGAAPNGGKSSLATYLAMKMEDPYDHDKIPSLYFSADSDITTFGMRAGAIALENSSVREVEKLVLEKDDTTLGVLERETDHMWVCFDSSPSCRDISDEIDMYALINGDYPQLVVVDNLMDVTRGNVDERDGHDSILDFLRQLARRTAAAVLVLCHVTGKDGDGNFFTDGDVPIPRSGLMNKIDKRPRLILTLFNVSENVLGICVVKNNNGAAAASGSLQVHIPWMKEKMWFGSGR